MYYIKSKITAAGKRKDYLCGQHLSLKGVGDFFGADIYNIPNFRFYVHFHPLGIHGEVYKDLILQ